VAGANEGTSISVCGVRLNITGGPTIGDVI